MIDWSHPIAARWRRELFEYVHKTLGVSSSGMWNLIALVHRDHLEWQDDTILLNIAKFFGIQIPARVWGYWCPVVCCAKNLEIIRPAAPDRRYRGGAES